MRSPVLTLKRAKRLRRVMTLPEIILWQHLRNRGLNGLHFRHQHPAGPYILDFYCSAARLCVEIDGQQHATLDAGRYDDARTAWLESQGIRVLRFAASDVLKDDHIEGVLIAHRASCLHHLTAVPLPRFTVEDPSHNRRCEQSAAPPHSC